MGWYRCLLRFFVSINFFRLLGFLVFLRFLPKIFVRAIMVHQKRPQPLQRNHFVGVALKNGRARHPADYAAVFTLRDGHAPCAFDRAQAFSAVVTHPGHQNAHGEKPKFLCHRVKEHIRGGAVAIDRWTIRQSHHVAARHAAHHNVAIPGANQNTAREKEIAGARFVHFERAAFVQALGKHFGKAFRHVLHDEDGRKKIAWDLRQHELQRVGPSRGNSDRDNAAGWQRGAACFCESGQFFLDRDRRELALSRVLGDLDFRDQLVGNFLEAARGGISWFCEKIHGAERQSFQRGVAALFRMRAEKDDGQRCAVHDEAQHFHAVHARHFEIERNNIGLEFLDLLERESAIHRRADNLYGGVTREDRGNQLPHERGIVYDEDSDALAHAIAPRGVARERRERIAGTFRIRTTVPSPRMEAPLTRSLETISPGSALMTNSSSPTRLSTTRPKRFSAAPITMTKFFFLAGWESILRSRLK